MTTPGALGRTLALTVPALQPFITLKRIQTENVLSGTRQHLILDLFADLAHLCHCLRVRLYSSRTIFAHTDLFFVHIPQPYQQLTRRQRIHSWSAGDIGKVSSALPSFAYLWYNKLTMLCGHTASSLAVCRTGQEITQVLSYYYSHLQPYRIKI